MRKMTKALLVALVLAVMIGVVGQRTVHADGFWNCVTYWWYTDCSYIDLDLMSSDVNSVGFEALYRLCQMVGLCP